MQQKVLAPQAPGGYVLELDPVFETVAWFSEKNGGKTLRPARRGRYRRPAGAR